MLEVEINQGHSDEYNIEELRKKAVFKLAQR
jgi:hypothetical protein